MPELFTGVTPAKQINKANQYESLSASYGTLPAFAPIIVPINTD
ncbi:hypothetical protein [Shewanella sp. SNU WT4]|nr:hypothetical protein [Shewanella sp. SNU WT4]